MPPPVSAGHYAADDDDDDDDGDDEADEADACHCFPLNLNLLDASAAKGDAVTVAAAAAAFATAPLPWYLADDITVSCSLSSESSTPSSSLVEISSISASFTESSSCCSAPAARKQRLSSARKAGPPFRRCCEAIEQPMGLWLVHKLWRLKRDTFSVLHRVPIVEWLIALTLCLITSLSLLSDISPETLAHLPEDELPADALIAVVPQNDENFSLLASPARQEDK
uniref:Uncharacterized protein n=1 Tax=Glossina austeni TaxID=7395 RepID=A0A1A9USW4_GLOAU